MKILFLLLQLSDEGKGSGMYLNLATEFRDNGHDVTLMAPDNAHSSCYERVENGMRVVRVNSKATQGVPNMIKKGIGLATLGYYFKKAYKRYIKNENFDWIFMPTPPITLSLLASYIKNRTGAKFYLILRDIHPQSTWSIGLLKYRWMYWYLDKKARVGYEAADLIGCMSQGNIDFVAQQYPSLDKRKLVLLYNWLKKGESHGDGPIRPRYGLEGKTIALFGGTIGKGQRIENIVYLAEHYKAKPEVVFLVIGKGVEKDRLKSIVEEKKLSNVRIMDFMPQQDYLNVVSSVDIGLISINENYAVPTCPSKAISYMALGIPVFAMINSGSDYGQWIEDAGAGYWTVGSDKERTVSLFDKLLSDTELRKSMGAQGRDYYEKHCTSEKAYETMLSQINNI
jgi:glycosyltransferase involved in cell wall biosynthesis